MTDWLSDRFGLCGQVALVTGARTGIGRASALALARAGADLVLWTRRAGDAEDVAAEITALGRRVATVHGDLGDPGTAAEIADRVLAEHRIDILVNNAGIIHRGPAEDGTLPQWRTVLATNLDTPYLLCLRFGTRMRDRGHGRIVNIASLLSFQGGVGVAAYAASKHGIAGLTKALANEWAEHGVNVNALAPGYVVTANTEPLRADPKRETAISERIPAGQWADAEDIATSVVFLSSPAAAYIHGHVLVVDGGWMGR